MSQFEVNFSVDFDVDSPKRSEEKNPDNDQRRSDSIPPAHGPELQIIPYSETADTDIAEYDRQIVQRILNEEAMPWINPPKKPEIGQA